MMNHSARTTTTTNSSHEQKQQLMKLNNNNNNRKRLTEDQVSLLESSFNINKKLDPERKLHLSRELGIPPRQIAIWYQNKRARWKNQSLELDYSALQLRLEATLADKKHLQKEVERLHLELNQARALIIQAHEAQLAAQAQAAQGAQYNPNNIVSPDLSSNCYDEAGSSCNFNGDLNMNNCRSWDINDEVLQVEEMYACLIGATNGSSNFA